MQVNLTFHVQMLEAIAKCGLGDDYSWTPEGALQTNCVVFGHDVVGKVYDTEWTLGEYKRAMLMDTREPFSTTQVLVDKGLALEADPDLDKATSTRWFAWQYWKEMDPLKSGHFGFAYIKPGGTMLIVDATNASREWCREVPLENLKTFFDIGPHGNIQVVALKPTDKERT